MPFHANDVLQRARVLIGFACALILFATLCGHAILEGWENGAGRCMAASRPLFTARWCGAHCGADSAMWLRSPARQWWWVDESVDLRRDGGIVPPLFFFCEGVRLFLVSVMRQTDRQRE
ncbi:hypothetical protein TcCL_Unassigned01637 [Trypanosoma cruzi]|nr:hypothetical protein TcCL_Unassigned01637 [Trypanosoma cruzi]